VPGPRAALITISTSRSEGVGEDLSGIQLDRFAKRLGVEIAGREVIGDDRALIERRLRHWIDAADCCLVLTSGGTGLSPDDVTPEATSAVIEREVPGIAEAMRRASSAHTSRWMLSRGIAGVCGATLIVNFPGNPKSIQQTGEAILEAIPHALALIAGRTHAH
jgi:molybdenum cofactor synthesis domain-containing protein